MVLKLPYHSTPKDEKEEVEVQMPSVDWTPCAHELKRDQTQHCPS